MNIFPVHPVGNSQQTTSVGYATDKRMNMKVHDELRNISLTSILLQIFSSHVQIILLWKPPPSGTEKREFI